MMRLWLDEVSSTAGRGFRINKANNCEGSSAGATNSHAPRNAIFICCGQSGHCISINGCDELARFLKIKKYLSDSNPKKKEEVKKALKTSVEYQQERLQKKFAGARNKARRHIKKLIQENEITTTDEIATVKSLFLDTHRENYDPSAPSNIFDDLDVIEEEYETENDCEGTARVKIEEQE